MKYFLCLFLLLSFNTHVSAYLIDNGSRTLDTATGLEWLDLRLTYGQSVNDIQGGFGGHWDAGFRYATTSELNSLLSYAYLDADGLSISYLPDSAIELFTLLDPFYRENESIYAIYEPNESSPGTAKLIEMGTWHGSAYAFSDYPPVDFNARSYAFANFLVRDTIEVTEPSNLIIIATLLLMLSQRRCTNNLER